MAPVCCPSELLQVSQQIHSLPERAANDRIETNETMCPLTEPTDKVQQDVDQQGGPDLPTNPIG